jgi:hypothetical protein
MQTLEKTESKKRVKIVLIDPFKGALVPLAVDPSDLAALHKLCDCDLFASHRLTDHAVLWFDENALAREPEPYPRFCIYDERGSGIEVAGFGLLTGPLGKDELISGLAAANAILGQLAQVVRFEHWTERMDPYLYLNQLFRIYPVSDIP